MMKNQNKFTTKVTDCSPRSLELAAELINLGEVVAFPTETVYGLGASAFNPQAIKKIYLAKNRPSDNPLIVHIYAKSELVKVARDIPKAAYDLIDRFMPGPLTLILKRNENVPKEVSSGLDTVAVRIPQKPEALQFLKACKVPIAAPSANLSSRPSTTTARHVYDDLMGKIPLILDGGKCRFGVESTILDMTTATPTLLRPGAVPLVSLLSVLGNIETAKLNTIVPKAPGQKYRHYSPKCRLIFSSYHENMIELVNAAYEKLTREGINAVVFCLSKNAINYKNPVIMGLDNREAAHNLFSLMREYEKKVDCIVVEGIKPDETGDALINRLVKASGGNIF